MPHIATPMHLFVHIFPFFIYFMRLRWRLFCYDKRVRTGEDYRSVCNTSIFPYGQTIFRNECRDSLSIYSNASKQLELLIDSTSIQVRLDVWGAAASTSILLEQHLIDGLNFCRQEQSICFGCADNAHGDVSRFSIRFYKQRETMAFLDAISRSSREYRGLIEELNKLTGPASGAVVHRKNVRNYGDFLFQLGRLGFSSKLD